MSMEITNNYSGVYESTYAVQSVAGNTKKKETEKHRRQQRAVNPRVQ